MSFTPQPRQAMRGLARLPWAFEPNVGETDPKVKFLARADGATVFLTQDEAVITWQTPRTKHSRAADESQDALRLQFADISSNRAISGEDELPGKTNYLLGRDPSKWRTNVPHFSAVNYREIYPGVSARFYGGPLGLEYDLRVSPGSDLGSVTLRANDSSHLRLDARGNLLVRLADREVLMRKPEIYQPDGTRKIPVQGGYRLLGDNSFGFRVGPYRADLPLIIDPSISVTYTTFLGGNGAEKGNSVAVDSSGAIYVGGTTTDIATFPETSPTPTNIGLLTGTSKLFVAKIDTTKTGAASLVYLTFIGGSGNDQGGKIAVDNSVLPPDLAIVGWTTSSDFPVTDGSTLKGTTDLTVSKLTGTGNAFAYSMYFGGTGSEATQSAVGTATDTAGDVFVTSDTTSTDLPTTSNAISSLSGSGGATPDGFLAEFNSISGAMTYSTYLGINATVGGTGVAVDTSSTPNAYVVGFTSGALPAAYTLTNSFQSAYGGGAFDAFIIQINPASLVSGSAGIVYASLLGGGGSDQAFAIALDNQSPPSAYITGKTSSTDFVPSGLQSSAFQPCFGSTSLTPCPVSAATSNAFFAVVSQAAVTFAPSLAYASYLGGTGADSGQGVAVVSTSDVLVAGSTTSTDFPVFCPSQGFSGSQDIFIASFNPTASGTASLGLSTFLGGSATAEANAIATDASGDAIVFGDTLSHDFPAVSNPNNGFQPTCTSCQLTTPEPDAFLTVSSVSTAAAACVAFSPAAASFGSFPVGSTTVPPVNANVTNDGNANLNVTGLTILGANSTDFQLVAGTTCTGATVLTPGGTCNLSVGFTPSVAGAEAAAVQFTDNGAGSPQSFALSGTGTAPEVTLTTTPPTSPASLTFGSVPVGATSSTQTVVLTNTGNAPLTVSSVTLDPSGNPVDFVVNPSGTPNVCGLSGAIAPNSTCNIAVQFAPQTTGPLTAQVDIADDANNTSGGATQTIALSGTGTTPTPIVGLSPASVSFANQNLGTTSTPQPITLTNSGSAALSITSITLTGPNANQFKFDPATTCPTAGGTVAANNGTCTIEVDFAPNSPGSANAAVSIVDNATNSPQAVPLTGTGIGAVAGLSANSISFGAVGVGTTSSPMTVTVTNNGNQNLTISSVTIDPAVGTPGDFAILNSSTCPTAGSMTPSASCTITVSFTPAVQGSVTGQIDISDNASPGTQNIALDGTGTAAGAGLSSNSISFGNVSVGTTSSVQTVTLTNTGNVNLVTSSLGPVAGTNPNDFQIVSGQTTCTVGGSGVAANGGTCVIAVDFVPQASGSRSASISIADNAANSPQSIALDGTGTQPAVSFSPGSFAFGSVNVGVTSSPVTVTVTNTGNQTLAISSVKIDPSIGTPGDFSFTGSNTCATVGSLAPSATCTITVSFTPSTQGNETGQVDVSDDAPNSPQNILMNGTGTAAGVSLSPSALPFGNQSVGTTSTAQTVALTNTGNINLVISSLSITGTNPTDFQIVSGQTTCAVGGAGVTANGGTCIIAVDFAPQASGSLSASVSIADNAASSPQTIALSGTGTQPAVMLSQNPISFGSVNVGSTSTAPSVTLTNTGNQTLAISSVAIDGNVGTPGDFALSGSNTCQTVGTLAPNATCTITVSFSPSSQATETGQVDITDDAPGSPQKIALNGTGTAPGVSLSPTTLTFPSTSVGKTSAVKIVTLTNTGSSTLDISSILTTGTNPADFQVVLAQTTCPIGGSGVGAGGSCNIAVDFVPQASGSRFASVSITDNAASSPQTVALSGTGTQPAVTLSSNAIAFGSVNVGTTATQPSVTLTNTGNQALTISSVKINSSIGTPGDFALSGSNTCETIGSLAPNGTCTVSVTFTPAATGAVTGRVDITDDAPGSPHTIALTGTGTAPGISLAPSSLSFGNEDVGSTSAAQNVTLTNTGSGPLTINSITFTGSNIGDFGQTNNCPISPAQLASSSACIVSVTFAPTAKGARSASLSVSDSGPGTPQKVAVSGTGTQPAVALSPSSGIAFPATIVGAASGTRALTVTNTGNGPLIFSSISFTGTNPGDFSETDNCTGSGVTVAAGGNCVINVNFTPSAPGVRSANIVLTDNALPSTQQDSVGGQATDFQLQASGGSTSATITAGETAIFPLQVNPVSGFTGTVTFGCTNPPPKGTCTVSPPSIQITGSTPVSFSVSVGTASNAFLLPRAPRAWPRTPKLPVFMWMIGLLVAFWLCRSRGQRKRVATRYVLGFAVLLLSSCGGGGGGNTGGNGTPPGSYTVTATGSVGSGAARTLNLTVKVQ